MTENYILKNKIAVLNGLAGASLFYALTTLSDIIATLIAVEISNEMYLEQLKITITSIAICTLLVMVSVWINKSKT